MAKFGFLNRTTFDVYDEGEGDFVVLEPLTYLSSTNETYQIPAGFITNFASYPFVGRAVYGVNDDSRYAAVLHDYLYSTGQVSRKKADKLFLEVLSLKQVRATKRYLMYWVLRGFGWCRYTRHGKAPMVPVHLLSKYRLAI